jgi:hypothetical protein
VERLKFCSAKLNAPIAAETALIVFFDFITFRKPGVFDVAEQHSKHPIFLQTEET